MELWASGQWLHSVSSHVQHACMNCEPLHAEDVPICCPLACVIAWCVQLFNLVIRLFMLFKGLQIFSSASVNSWALSQGDGLPATPSKPHKPMKVPARLFAGVLHEMLHLQTTTFKAHSLTRKSANLVQPRSWPAQLYRKCQALTEKTNTTQALQFRRARFAVSLCFDSDAHLVRKCGH